MNIELTCECCGTLYRTWEAWAKKSKRHFCSIACRKEAYRADPARKSEYYKEYYRKNKDRYIENYNRRKEANKEKKREYDRMRREAYGDEIRAQGRDRNFFARGELKTLIGRAKARCRKSGLPCTITESDLCIPSHCPVLGIPMYPSSKQGGIDNSPSIDRIRPELGYVPGNVVVISTRANRIKSNATPEEIVLMARWAASMLGHPPCEEQSSEHPPLFETNRGQKWASAEGFGEI